MKRAFDIVLSALGLIVLFPLGLVISGWIWLSDRGPVFYGQTRIGQFGKPFRIWKFRSMVANADGMGAAVTKQGDPRITRVGRILRSTKLDELPQLWNVFTGEMSLVGPRPEVPRYVELYSAEEREILQYRPGITDFATLLFRNEESLLHGADDLEAFYVRYCLPKKIQLNREYARRASLIQDLWVVLQTIGAILRDAASSAGRRFISVKGPQPSSATLPAANRKAAVPTNRVAIIGTGQRAANLAGDLKRNGQSRVEIVAFFDDDPRVWHKRILNTPVFGMPECLLNRNWSRQVDEVFVVLPDDNCGRIHEIRELLRPSGLKVTLPGLALPLAQS